MNFSSPFFYDPQQAVNIPFLYYKLLDQFAHIMEFSTLGSHINAFEASKYRTIVFSLWSCCILWGILRKICLVSSRVVYVEFDVDAERVMGRGTNCSLRIRFHHWLLNKYYSYRIEILLKQYEWFDQIIEDTNYAHLYGKLNLFQNETIRNYWSIIFVIFIMNHYI